MSERTHFGFDSLSTSDKQNAVMDIFSDVASQYDLMNDLMSGMMHRLWKRRMLAMSLVRPGNAALDVATGTADIALGLARRMKSDGLLVCSDLNSEMLQGGMDRLLDHGYYPPFAESVQADGSCLPFDDGSFDSVTIAFGIRNFVDVPGGLKEMHRVLKPGGQWMCMEFSRPVLPMLEWVYDAYSFNVIPAIGEMATGNRQAYEYLVESIRRFPDQPRFMKLMHTAGFRQTRYTNMSGGIVALYEGYRIG